MSELYMYKYAGLAMSVAGYSVGVSTCEIQEDDDDLIVFGNWFAHDAEAPWAEVEYEGEPDPQNYVDDGGWGDKQEDTYWVKVVVYRKTWRIAADGSVSEERIDEKTVKVAIDPDEPECEVGREHKWCAPHEVVGGIKENPGVWGRGAGVLMTRVCKYCGVYCKTNTWAQDRTDGEQGLTSVRYEEADATSLEWVSEGGGDADEDDE